MQIKTVSLVSLCSLLGALGCRYETNNYPIAPEQTSASVETGNDSVGQNPQSNQEDGGSFSDSDSATVPALDAGLADVISFTDAHADALVDAGAMNPDAALIWSSQDTDAGQYSFVSNQGDVCIKNFNSRCSDSLFSIEWDCSGTNIFPAGQPDFCQFERTFSSAEMMVAMMVEPNLFCCHSK